MSHITNATLAITTETLTINARETVAKHPSSASTEGARALHPGRLHAGDTNEGLGPA